MLDLRQWQLEALNAWELAQRRGIVAAATGTGKTRLALAALERASSEGARSVVVVPTRVLQEQWLRELRSAKIVPARRIGAIGGPAPNPSPDHLITVAVIDSARSGIRNLMAHWSALRIPTLLVVDECHWAGSNHNRGVFEGDPRWRLGLSATPERGDDGFDDVLVPELGGVVFRYSLKDAMDDGVLADLRLVNLLIDLSAQEIWAYEDLQRRIEAAVEDLRVTDPNLFQQADWTADVALAAKVNPKAKRVTTLIAERRRLLSGSSARFSLVRELIDDGHFFGRRTIIFNETIQQAERVALLARNAGINVAVDHSKMSTSDRAASQSRFRAGSSSCLVVVRAADEGLDVPDADQAVIVSGTLNARQRIQRLGRVVRTGGLPPRAISLLAKGTTEETVVAGRDRELLGVDRVRVLHCRTDQLESMWD